MSDTISPQASELLTALCASLGMPSQRALAEPSLVIDLSGCPMEIAFQAGTANGHGHFVMTTFIGEVELDDDLGRLAARLLQANMVWQETQGSALCLTADMDGVVLRRWVMLDGLDLPALRQHIEWHLGATLAWQKAYPTVTDTAPAADSAAGEAVQQMNTESRLSPALRA